MLIRERQDSDLAAIVQALRSVHETDHYPMIWPADPAKWLTPTGTLTAWVALDTTTGAILGHVALCAVANGADAQPWVAATGRPPVELAEVSRLFVALEARSQGLGAQLLTSARILARRRQLRPVLRVSAHDRGAMALYEHEGWIRIVSVNMPWAVANPADALLHYYIGPESDKRQT